jgi:ubiquinone/menaquinone biosynthesis C-methylase UbiE
MSSYLLDVLATDDNFNEGGYLALNPDVAAAVRDGGFKSGYDHFCHFGKKERRLQRDSTALHRAKTAKLARIRPLLRTDLPFVESSMMYDFLSNELREEFNIVDTDAVSSNGYDRYAMELIEKYKDGVVLDCGAGRRSVYFDNVVNLEIVAYDSTDVRGVGEVLPFNSASFDVIFSLAVLEHVKDPFRCASEIVRVLKPGGDLMCCVPFLQPLHGYPHHYYNMTPQGLRNLFVNQLEIDKIDCYASVLPIWSLAWILNSWASGLSESTRKEFLEMRVSELLHSPVRHLDRPFVKELSPEKNFELASATVLFAHKTNPH